MKSIYVVNLDIKRIILIVLCLLSLLTLSFLAGKQSITHLNQILQKHATQLKKNPNNYTTEHINKSSNESTLSNAQSTLNTNKPPIDIYSSKTSKVTNTNTGILNPIKKTQPISNNNKVNSTIQKTSTSLPKDKISKSITSSKPKYYIIQLGAFKHEKDAYHYKKELQKKGIQANVLRGIIYYIVYTGKNANKKPLESKLNNINSKLKEKGYIVKRNLAS